MQPDDLELSPAGFTEHLGQLAAPIDLPAGTVVRGVAVELRCLDIETRAIACVRATDPLDPEVAEAWCAPNDACTDAVDTFVIAMPEVTVGPRRTLEVIVMSPDLASVQVRGAQVTLGTARASTSVRALGASHHHGRYRRGVLRAARAGPDAARRSTSRDRMHDSPEGYRMENEDTKREAPGWAGRRETSNTFTRAMAEVVAGCQNLVAAIDHHDFEGVEHVARHAASMWLTGHAAHRRLTPRPDGATTSDAVKALLEGRTTLLDLFARAKAQIAVPRTHRALDELGALLSGADAEPVADAPHRS